MHAFPAILEAHRFAGRGDLSVDAEPKALMIRHQFTNRLALGIRQPGVFRERRIDLDEAIVDRLTGVVVDHVDDAKAFIDRVEERAVALFAAAQRSLCLLPGCDVARGAEPFDDFPLVIEDRYRP